MISPQLHWVISGDNFIPYIHNLNDLISTVRSNKVVAESKAYKKIPGLINKIDENGVSHMKEMIQENYNYIKAEVKQIVADELERIRNNDEGVRKGTLH